MLNSTKRSALALVVLLFALEGSALAQQPVQPLPQTGTPADNESNTSAQLSRVGAYNFVFDGSTWDRWTGSVTVSGTVAVTQSGTWTVQPGNTANSTAWLVTGTGGTFPATQSGTWTVQPGNTANTTAWKVDGSAVTQPVSIATNTPIGSIAHDAAGAGVNPLLTGGYASAAAPSDVSADNDAVRGWYLRNGAQAVQPTYGGTLQAAGNGTAATSARVTIASDSTGTVAATQSGTWNITNVSGTVSLPTGAATQTTLASILAALVADPCAANAKTRVVFSIATATTTQLIAASASNKNYICDVDLVVGGADNVALVEDDTAACASPTAGMAGGTTAATGWNFAANGGLAKGDGGHTVFQTAATNRYTCFITSAAVQVSGSLSYVQVP